LVLPTIGRGEVVCGHTFHRIGKSPKSEPVPSSLAHEATCVGASPSNYIWPTYGGGDPVIPKGFSIAEGSGVLGWLQAGL
jgi:hypothetical protein